MAAGESAAQRARATAAAAARMRARADRVARAAEAWRLGSEGETKVAQLVAPLAAAGYHHLADRALPGSRANIDHVVIGPAGVFVIDAKQWSGTLLIEGRSLRQDGRRRDTAIESARSYALAVSQALEGAIAGKRVPVRPIVCFVGSASIGSRVALDRVHLLDADGLVAFIESVPPVLTGAEVEAALVRLVQQLPPKTGAAQAALPITEPQELVLFLQRWKKAGRHRLYVKQTDGHDVGYLDLVTGKVHAPTEEWEDVLIQLLPHYLRGDTPGMGADDLGKEAQGAIRRFLDSLLRRTTRRPERIIVACYHWRGHGRSRLYLNRLEPGGTRLDLGWFDVDTGNYSAERPGALSVLGYCGQRFQQIEAQRRRS